ncbi:reverse transcriptase domain-containing protein [Tanacetum coccineum]|uniref:Reverse transcriptase domain-containing protein n=1 Tax=Tanacetum coccineum TaxID=301880 RepID=A0ABQ5F9M1_9ASTR
MIAIAATLSKTLKEKLCGLLRSNKDIFVCTPADMTGIPLKLAEQKLNIESRTFLNAEAEADFHELKSHLQSLPALTVPKPEETLILYLAAATEAVRAILLRERGNVQKPIYFVSRALQGSEINYPNLKKAIELGEHEILCKPRSAIKGQILPNFLAESPTVIDSHAKYIIGTPRKGTSTWAMFTDGAFTSNNEVEYKALVAGLELAIQMEAQYLEVYTDSLLIANQVKGPVQANYVLHEAHLGSCGAHTEPRRTAQKAVRLGYYWPIMYQDETRVCEINIVGPFPESPGRVKFLIVAIDYFTMWAEAEHVATITGMIISGNEKQFANNPFRELGEELEIKQKFTSVAHSQAYITIARIGNGCTPFSLVYGSEAILPPEIGLPTYRINTFQPATNDMKLRLNLDFLEEQREMASLRNARYKRQIEGYYNKRVRNNQLQISDFVLRKNEASRQEGQRKLDPNWEGPYQIVDAKRTGTYVLADMKGHIVSRKLQISNLRKSHL